MQKNAEELYNIYLNIARNKYSYLLLRLEQITNYINSIELGVGDWESKVLETFQMINDIKNTFDSAVPRSNDPDFTPENTPVVVARNIPGELKMVLESLAVVDADWLKCVDVPLNIQGDVFSDRNPYELNIQTARNKYSYLLLRLEQITGYINGIELGDGDFGSKVFEVFKMINKIKDTFDSVTPRNSDPEFHPSPFCFRYHTLPLRKVLRNMICYLLFPQKTPHHLLNIGTGVPTRTPSRLRPTLSESGTYCRNMRRKDTQIRNPTLLSRDLGGCL